MGCGASADAGVATDASYAPTKGGAAGGAAGGSAAATPEKPAVKPAASASVAPPSADSNGVKIQVASVPPAAPKPEVKAPAAVVASAPAIEQKQPMPQPSAPPAAAVVPPPAVVAAPVVQPQQPIAAAAASAAAGTPGAATRSVAGANPNAGAPGHVIVVTIWQGKDIKKMDVLSASDSYLKVRVGGEEKRTTVKDDSTDPIWSERLKFSFEPDKPVPTQIVLECMDKNTVTKDSFIGLHKIDIPPSAWDPNGPPAVPEWRQLEGDTVDLKTGKKELTGRIQVTVKCQLVYNSSASEFFKFDYSHLMTVTLLEGRGLKPMELVGANSPYAVLAWGNKIFRTAVAPKSNDPKWNQTCVFWCDERKQSHYDLSVMVWDKDRLSADDHIGAAYVHVIKRFLHPEQNEKAGDSKDGAVKPAAAAAAAPVAAAAPAAAAPAGDEDVVHDIWVPLIHPTETDKDLAVDQAHAARHARKTNAAAAPEMPDASFTPAVPAGAAAVGVAAGGKADVKVDAKVDAKSTAPPGGPAARTMTVDPARAKDSLGEVHLRITLTPKAKIEKKFYTHLLKEFGVPSAPTVAAAEAKGGAAAVAALGFDRSAIHALLGAMDVHLSENEFEHWFRLADVDGNQTISETELVPLIRSVESHNQETAARIWKYLADHVQFGGTSRGSLLMEGVSQDRSSDFIWVRERSNGRQVKENIPKYISVALKSMFGTGAARYLTNLSTSVKLAENASIAQGKKYNDPASVKEIPPFIALHGLPTEEMSQPVAQYKTFNEFFARALKPEARPISKEDADPSVCVSPADCRMMVFRDLIEATQLWIKGDQFTMANVLGAAKAHLADKYQGGSMVIARLAPQDYHRWHVPVAGMLGDRTPIPGALFTVNPIAINKNVNVYSRNKREIIELESKEFGKVLIVPVGAVMVGSITILKDKCAVQKGEPHGYFQFGGSTVLLFFEPNTIQFDPDLIYFSQQKLETLIRVNTRIGHSIRHLSAQEKKEKALADQRAAVEPPVMALVQPIAAPSAQALPAGKLTFIVVAGKNLKDMDLVGKMDPYTIVKVGSTELKTEVMSGAGLNPKFDSRFTVDVDGTVDTMYVNVMDRDVGAASDDHIGRCDIPLLTLVNPATINQPQVFTLFNAKDEMTGELVVKCQSFVAGAAPAPAVGGAAPAQAPAQENVIASASAAIVPSAASIAAPALPLGPIVGRLSLTVLSGRNLKDMDAVGKMDPFVILRVGAVERKTSVQKDAGCNPTFNLAFDFDLDGSVDQVFVNVMDEDVGSADHIGRVDVTLTQLLASIGQKNGVAYSLVNAADEKTGELLIRCDAFVAGAPPAVAATAAAAKK